MGIIKFDTFISERLIGKFDSFQRLFLKKKKCNDYIEMYNVLICSKVWLCVMLSHKVIQF